MAKLLVVASIAWPLFLASGWWSRADGGPPWLTVAVYLSAGRVCHQRPERSFFTGNVQWPVCGRCAGLYLAAPVGALAAFARRRRGGAPHATWLVVAALPTAVTMAVELASLAPVSSVVRAAAALPLGVAIGFFIVAVSAERHEEQETDSRGRFPKPIE